MNSSLIPLYPEEVKRRKFRSSYAAPIVLVVTAFLLIAVFSIRFYRYVWQPNIHLEGKDHVFLYIPTGTDFEALTRIIRKDGFIRSEKSFRFVSRRKNYTGNVKAGRYRITEGMNNNELVNILRAGIQEPVEVKFTNARTPAELAGRIGRQIEADSVDFIRLFNDPEYLRRFGLSPEQVFVLFIPNTYQFYWNTQAMQFMDRMSREMLSFWSGNRKALLDSTGLSIPDVVTLASIVEKETNNEEEKPDIAGVYINRLRKGWPLQADPTIIFALQDFTIRRIKSEQLKVDSKYNTYRYKGLPPGPICIPSVRSVDAVLHYKKHKYVYFCAKEDLSGTHNFAETLIQHQANARKYQKALDKMNIR